MNVTVKTIAPGWLQFKNEFDEILNLKIDTIIAFSPMPGINWNDKTKSPESVPAPCKFWDSWFQTRMVSVPKEDAYSPYVGLHITSGIFFHFCDIMFIF